LEECINASVDPQQTSEDSGSREIEDRRNERLKRAQIHNAS